jgi:type VI secretion system protein VasD
MNRRNMGRFYTGACWARGLTLLVMATALAACGVTDRASKRVDDTWAGDMLFGDKEKLILTADGGNQLNPGDDGKPLSVVLRVYQLTSLERFASSDADTLWAAPQQALGNTLIESQEITLLPGIGQVDQWPLQPAANYVGMAAFFRSEQNARWKVAFDARSLRRDGIWFSSDGLRVLVDNNQVLAARGVDVLNKPPTEAQLVTSNVMPQRPAMPAPLSDSQGMAVQKAEAAATDAAKKRLPAQTDLPVDSVHE